MPSGKLVYRFALPRLIRGMGQKKSRQTAAQKVNREASNRVDKATRIQRTGYADVRPKPITTG
jgi:hypothetical protein